MKSHCLRARQRVENGPAPHVSVSICANLYRTEERIASELDIIGGHSSTAFAHVISDTDPQSRALLGIEMTPARVAAYPLPYREPAPRTMRRF